MKKKFDCQDQNRISGPTPVTSRQMETPCPHITLKLVLKSCKKKFYNSPQRFPYLKVVDFPLADKYQANFKLSWKKKKVFDARQFSFLIYLGWLLPAYRFLQYWFSIQTRICFKLAKKVKQKQNFTLVRHSTLYETISHLLKWFTSFFYFDFFLAHIIPI